MTSLPYRIGFGYDIHRFKNGRPMILGGIEIPASFGLDGHSDADALSHAIADAILGALGLPDIGHFFPNDDPDIEGIDSQKIIVRAVQEAVKRGYAVGNIDCTILAEKPKIAAHIEPMKARLSQSLGVAATEIGIKATTHEGIGGIGRGEGLAAQAVVLLLRTS